MAETKTKARKVFRQLAEHDDQIIFSTHSSLLLDVAFFDEVIRVESVHFSENNERRVESKVWQLPMQKMINDLKSRYPSAQPTEQSMRELYSHAYHPNRSEGFFAQRVILVEGSTEQYSLPIYSEACGYALDKLNISVVDCGGKGSIDRLYCIFNELGIPCYILFDYDKNNSDKNIIEKSKDLLKLVGESPATPEKIIITDNVACFPDKWEIDLANEIENVKLLTNEAQKFLGLPKDTGKPLVARYIAKKVTSQTSPYVPNSIKKILEKAVNVEWKKSCLSSIQ